MKSSLYAKHHARVADMFMVHTFMDHLVIKQMLRQAEMHDAMRALAEAPPQRKELGKAS